MKKKLIPGIVVALLLLGGAAWLMRIRSASRPNVLIITMDTTRADHLGCYGYDLAFTPNLDRLAEDGLLFEQCRAPAPLTLPSHATIMTGLQPPEHGLRVNGKSRLPEDITTLAETLKADGYNTAAFIAASVLDSKYGLDRGFDLYDDDLPKQSPGGLRHAAQTGRLTPYRAAGEVVSAAGTWLSDATGPFLCWVHLYDPHDPYNAHPDVISKKFGNNYDAEIAYMDHHIGVLLNYLRDKDLLDSTIVVAVGDHGEDLYEHGEPAHGATLYDSVLRVPLIIRFPPSISAGTRSGSMCSLTGIFPAILDLLGKGDRTGDGTCLPALAAVDETGAHAHYGETLHPLEEYGWAPQYCAVSDGWKYIRSPIPELYDLASDAGETVNLAGSNPVKLAELEAVLETMESAMNRRQAESIQLSRADREKLRSLGYMAGAGRQREAQDDLRDVKQMMPVLRKAWDVTVRFDRNGETSDELVALCREVTGESPETRHLWVTLVAILGRRGEIGQAEKVCQEALQIHPDLAALYTTLAEACEMRGNVQGALSNYRRALDIDPDLLAAHVDLGGLLLTQNKPDAAAESFSTALSIDPDNNEAINNLGIALAMQGKLDEAAEHFGRAIEHTPDDPELYNNLGRVRALQGRDNEAIILYRRALELDPNYRSALANKAAIERKR